MSVNIKRIVNDDFDAMCVIVQSAYSGSFQGTKEERENLKTIFLKITEEDDITPIGAYKDNELVACMLYYEFNTNFHDKMMLSAGIGSLAVDLLHKKEKIAQSLIQYAFELSKKKNIELFSLYPFSVRFYRDFGFGYGTPMYTYNIAPSDFKEYSNKHILEYAKEKDYDDIINLYNEKAKSTNGMSLKTTSGIKRIKDLGKARILVAKLDNKLIGYMIFHQEGLKSANKQTQKLVVDEMIYIKRDALLAFSTFFNGQKDQIDFIDLFTYDDYFHYILRDISFVLEPKSLEIISLKSAERSQGMMYLALNPEQLLLRIGRRLDKTIKFNIIYPKTRVIKAFYINKGINDEICITLKLNEFSSWITGAISLNELYEHGRLETESIDLLRDLDYQLNLKKPKSYTRF